MMSLRAILSWPLRSVFFGAITVAFASFALPSVESRASTDQPDLAVYAAVEPTIQKDYEDAAQNQTFRQVFELHRQQFKKIVQDFSGKAIKGNWLDQLEDADDMIRMLSYNKASDTVACAEGAKLDAAAMTALDSPAYKSNFLPCRDKAASEMFKFIGTDNSYAVGFDSQHKPLFMSADKFAAKCETNARQRAREKVLKPYSFLDVKNPATMPLFAFEQYNLCRTLEAYNVAYAAAFPPEKKKK